MTSQPEPIDLNIAYEDSALLVINKPAGLVVHPGAGNTHGTLMNGLLYHYPELAELPRGQVARESWQRFGAIVLVDSLDEAPGLVNRLAPEHLEIATAEPERLGDRIHNAGAIFLGRYTPEVIGDYVSGSNHVLPTARSARFASGLGVLDFMKRTSLLKLDAGSLKTLGPPAMTLARAEGLEAHRRSVAIRLNVKG